MTYYGKLMLEQYRVLNNAWKTEIRDATRLATQMLSDMPRAEKINKNTNARYSSFPTPIGNPNSILDNRTSDICRALTAQDKVYLLNDASQNRHSRPRSGIHNYSQDDARDYIKALGSKTIRLDMTQR